MLLTVNNSSDNVTNCPFKFFLTVDVSKIARLVSNCVDPDQMPHNAASDLGIQFAKACLSQYS